MFNHCLGYSPLPSFLQSSSIFKGSVHHYDHHHGRTNAEPRPLPPRHDHHYHWLEHDHHNDHHVYNHWGRQNQSPDTTMRWRGQGATSPARRHPTTTTWPRRCKSHRLGLRYVLILLILQPSTANENQWRPMEACKDPPHLSSTTMTTTTCPHLILLKKPFSTPSIHRFTLFSCSPLVWSSQKLGSKFQVLVLGMSLSSGQDLSDRCHSFFTLRFWGWPIEINNMESRSLYISTFVDSL